MSTVNYQKFQVTVRVTSATTAVAVTALSARHAAYVTKVAFAFDDQAAGTVVVKDNSSTTQTLFEAVFSTSAPVMAAAHFSDNGMMGGVKVATGKNLQVVSTVSSGTANGWVYLEGYQRDQAPATSSEV